MERRPADGLSAVVGGGIRFAAPSGAPFFASLTSVAGSTLAPAEACFESCDVLEFIRTFTRDSSESVGGLDISTRCEQRRQERRRPRAKKTTTGFAFFKLFRLPLQSAVSGLTLSFVRLPKAGRAVAPVRNQENV